RGPRTLGVGEVRAQRAHGVAAERREALLLALAVDAREAVVEVELAAVESDRLGRTRPRRVHALEQRAVAPPARGRFVRAREQALDLGHLQRLRQRAPRARRAQALRGVLRDEPVLQEVLEERAHGRQAALDRGAPEALLVELREERAQRARA